MYRGGSISGVKFVELKLCLGVTPTRANLFGFVSCFFCVLSDGKTSKVTSRCPRRAGVVSYPRCSTFQGKIVLHCIITSKPDPEKAAESNSPVLLQV